MDKSQQDFLLDSRIVARNIRDGRVSRTVVEEFLKNLPDLESECVDISEQVFTSDRAKVAVSGEYMSNSDEE